MENKKINNDMLRVMFKSIRKAEDENIKTQKYDNKKMIKMIESYIEPGCQKVGEGIYGKSITDPCLGWEESEKLLYTIADMLK